MTKLDLYWATNPKWYTWKGTKRVIRQDAPAVAKESYQRYLRQLEAHKDAV